jgi:hypothetical protein
MPYKFFYSLPKIREPTIPQPATVSTELPNKVGISQDVILKIMMELLLALYPIIEIAQSASHYAIMQ